MKKFLSILLTLTLSLSLTALPASALELEDAKKLLQEYYVDEVPAAVLAAESLEDLFEALNDPYTVHMSREEYESFLSNVNGETVVGIGVSIHQVYIDGFQIVAVLPNSPALEAGLLAGDRVVAVDGVPLSAASNITNAIKGEEGTEVTITVLRGDNNERLDFTMIRRAVLIPIVTYEKSGTLGIIDCSSFGDSTSDVIMEALGTLDPEVTVWAIDLRENLGGTAESASAAAGFFAGTAVMTYMVDGNGASTYYFTPGWPDLTDKPLLVLTSPYSASGSELFAAAARDLEFGIGIGQRSYGKGIAQVIFDSSNTENMFTDDVLKLTVYRFYSPLGTTNHIVGILPTLLVSPEHVPPICELLSCPKPENSIAHLKLGLAGHTFYIDLAKARSEPFAEAFTALLEALPPSADLNIFATDFDWEEISPDALAHRLSLDYTPRTFSDLSDSRFAAQIRTLATYRLISGYEDGSFRPAQDITRAEFCAMVASALNLPAGTVSPFSDVSPDAWYAQAVSSMVSEGYVVGYEDGSFRPNAPISYQEMLCILSDVAVWCNMQLQQTCDDDLSMNDWGKYMDFAEWAQKSVRNLAGIGVPVDLLAPDALCSREAAAATLCSMLEALNMIWD